MGIKGFSTWLRTKFPVAFTTITKTPFTFDEVYIDLNSYLYKSAAHSTTAKQVLRQLEIKILNTLRSVRARHRIFISIDGVAPAAKLDVQRSRRASKALESARNRLFDAQNFTPGCIFMGKVEEALKKIGEKIAAKHGPEFEFIINGASVKEEGEIKIARELALQHNKADSSKRVARAVLTVDSDAFLQALVHEIPSLFILNAQDLKNGVGCFSGEIMRDELFRLLPTVSNRRQIELDFALLSIFSGNDCLPSMPFGNITYLWPGFLEYVGQTGKSYSGLVHVETSMINPEGVAAFARWFVANKVDDSTKKTFERHLADRPVKMTKESIVDYLKSAQWSFSRMLGNSVAQTLSLFLSPYPPTFYELASMEVSEVSSLLTEACASAKDNRLDKRKIPGAAAIMMLDPSTEKSVSYIAKPLKQIFKDFHAEDSNLDDHARFKKLSQLIADMPRDIFTPEEIDVTFARLPVKYFRRKHLWKAYDPSPSKSKPDGDDEDPSDQMEDAKENGQAPIGITPCPILSKLYAKKLAALK